jgi:hypothetical protein
VSDWDAKRVSRETGVTVEQLDYLERLCHQDLVEVPADSNRVRALSPRNLLVLALKWLRRYPTLEDLASEFGVARSSVDRYVQYVLAILDSQLDYMRSWPRQLRSKLLKGPLKDAIGAVDTFPICIPQPKSTEDRKRFYIYKPGHKTRYGYKVQTFVDLQGRILDVTDAFPFGSKADITLFRESRVPDNLNPASRAMAPAPENLASRLEQRMRNALGEAGEEEQDTKEVDNQHSQAYVEENSDLVPNISTALSEVRALSRPHKSLGDKAYIGSELIYVPYKKFKGKRFTPAKKDFNKLLSRRRVIVENVNKRLEDFKVLGTIYRGIKDDAVVSRIVRVVVSLHNYTCRCHPLRKHKRKAV